MSHRIRNFQDCFEKIAQRVSGILAWQMGPPMATTTTCWGHVIQVPGVVALTVGQIIYEPIYIYRYVYVYTYIHVCECLHIYI